MTERSRAQLTRRRRTRLLAGAAVVLGVGVLVTGMPVSALLTQHSQLGSEAARLSALDSANKALASQAQSLQDPSTIAGLARTEYGLVPSGQKAYVILPPSGSSPSTVAGSGHVPLDGPLVAPGSAASLSLLGVGQPSGGSTSQNASTRTASHATTRSTSATHSSFWSRGWCAPSSSGTKNHGVRDPGHESDPMDSDQKAVERLLGRPADVPFDVVVRDDNGGPVVIRNAPFLADGRPMPTLYWLVGADLREAVSRLEAEGGVRAPAQAVDPHQLAAAHHRYAVERDATIGFGQEGPRPSGGVGGTRRGVKCLHAHVAYLLAGGDDPVGRFVVESLGLDVSGYALDRGAP